jgi:hypothetical protein
MPGLRKAVRGWSPGWRRLTAQRGLTRPRQIITDMAMLRLEGRDQPAASSGRHGPCGPSGCQHCLCATRRPDAWPARRCGASAPPPHEARTSTAPDAAGGLAGRARRSWGHRRWGRPAAGARPRVGAAAWRSCSGQASTCRPGGEATRGIPPSTALTGTNARGGPSWPGCPPGRRPLGSRRGRLPSAWGGSLEGGRAEGREAWCRRAVNGGPVASTLHDRLQRRHSGFEGAARVLNGGRDRRPQRWGNRPRGLHGPRGDALEGSAGTCCSC